jgi:hypothetical protein
VISNKGPTPHYRNEVYLVCRNLQVSFWVTCREKEPSLVLAMV